MKKSFFFLMILFFPAINSFGESSPIAEGRIEEVADEKSSGDTVFVYQNGSSIDVEFLTENSNITVTIVSPKGVVVFCEVINTTAGMVYTIDVSNFVTGWYIIRIESKSGGKVTGSFYVD